MSSFLSGEGRKEGRACEDMQMLGNPKTPSRQVQIYLVLVSLHSVLSLRHASLPVPTFFFLFNIYSKVLCDVGALRYTTFLYSHNPAYRCLSRVPECVFACGRINV